MEKNGEILIIGQSEMIKSALLDRLKKDGYSNVRASETLEPDEKPEYIFFTEWVGGILSNVNYPAELMQDLTTLELDVIDRARKAGVKKMLFMARSCVYPAECPQPMKEDYILTGKFDKSTEPSAVATLWGIKMCQFYNRQYGTNFIIAIPTGVYGPLDDFELETAHVLPALIRRFHDAKMNSSPSVTLWGTGNPRREWLHVDDLVDALLFLMDNYEDSEVINIGLGEDLSIKEMAAEISHVIGYNGDVEYDTTKPDGAMRKLLDNSKLTGLGWTPKISFTEGITRTYDWFCTKG